MEFHRHLRLRRDRRPWPVADRRLRDRQWGHGDGYHRHRTRVDHRIGHRDDRDHPAAFNVRATITVVDPYTFTYSYVGGAYVSGTGLFSNHSAYWKAASGASAGQEPGVHVAWTRDYAVLPNGDNAISSQNRLLVPTWWQFDNNTAGSPGSYKAKRDYVAASDYLDYIHVALNQYFRINQGSSDELLVLREVRPGSVAAFKTGSVFLLDDVIGDLSTMSQRRLPIGYGLVNAKAIAQGGSNLHWMAPKRGVVSLVQTINNEIQGWMCPSVNRSSRGSIASTGRTGPRSGWSSGTTSCSWRSRSTMRSPSRST